MLFMYNDQNQKLLFLKKLAVVIILIFIFDYIIGFVLHKLYFSQTSGLNFRTTYALEETRSDIIILGTSRANHHYVPKIVSEVSKLSCYNAGRDGQHLIFQSAILKGILNRYSPKVIILDILPNQLLVKPENYGRLDALLPYYHSHEELRSIIESRSKLEKIKLLSKIYPYNSLLLTILKSNIVERRDDEGYIPLYGEIKNLNINTTDNEVADIENFDNNVILALDSMIKECKDSGVELYFVISPMFTLEKKYPRAMQELDKIVKKHNVQLVDFSEHPEFYNNPELFIDRTHMNNKGADFFSQIISKLIL